MTLTFLSPAGALLTLGIVAPLVALLFVRRRARRMRGRLGLSEPSVRRLGATLVALLFASALVGLAAAAARARAGEDVARSDGCRGVVVLDVSRSMLAQTGSGSPRRFYRAKNAANKACGPRCRACPVGIASMTTRVLPHLFPGTNEDVFRQRSTGRSASSGLLRRAASRRSRPTSVRSGRSAACGTSRRPRRDDSWLSSRTARAQRSRTRGSVRSSAPTCDRTDLRPFLG